MTKTAIIFSTIDESCPEIIAKAKFSLYRLIKFWEFYYIINWFQFDFLTQNRRSLEKISVGVTENDENNNVLK